MDGLGVTPESDYDVARIPPTPSVCPRRRTWTSMTACSATTATPAGPSSASPGIRGRTEIVWTRARSRSSMRSGRSTDRRSSSPSTGSATDRTGARPTDGPQRQDNPIVSYCGQAPTTMSRASGGSGTDASSTKTAPSSDTLVVRLFVPWAVQLVGSHQLSSRRISMSMAGST